MRTKLLKVASKKVLRNFGYKRREPIFQVWGGGKKGGNQNFPKILGGTKALHTMISKLKKILLSKTESVTKAFSPALFS